MYITVLLFLSIYYSVSVDNLCQVSVVSSAQTGYHDWKVS